MSMQDSHSSESDLCLEEFKLPSNDVSEDDLDLDTLMNPDINSLVFSGGGGTCHSDDDYTPGKIFSRILFKNTVIKWEGNKEQIHYVKLQSIQ